MRLFCLAVWVCIVAFCLQLFLHFVCVMHFLLHVYHMFALCLLCFGTLSRGPACVAQISSRQSAAFISSSSTCKCRSAPEMRKAPACENSSRHLRVAMSLRTLLLMAIILFQFIWKLYEIDFKLHRFNWLLNCGFMFSTKFANIYNLFQYHCTMIYQMRWRMCVCETLQDLQESHCVWQKPEEYYGKC